MRGLGRLAVITLCISAVIAGCGKRAEREPPRADSTATAPNAALPTAAADERPAELLGPAIGDRDSLMRLIGPHLKPWVAMWQQASPAFRVESLRSVGFRGARSAYTIRLSERDSALESQKFPSDVALALEIKAPGGRRAVVTDIYQVVDQGDLGGEPDSAPALLDYGTGVLTVLSVTGPSAGNHWAAWIDSTRFVIGGWSESESDGDPRYGTLEYYDLSKGITAQYVGPEAGGADYERYYAAWREWILARYRAAQKRKHPA